MILRTIVFIETIDQYLVFEKWIAAHNRDITDIVIIAMTPKTRALLLKKGIPHDNTVHYFGRTGHEKALAYSGRVMAMLRETIELEDNFGNSQAYKHYILFNLRLFLHYVLFSIEVIHQAVQVYQAEELIVPLVSDNMGIAANNTTYPSQLSGLVEAYCKHQKLVFNGLIVPHAVANQFLKGTASQLKRRIAGWLHPFLCNLHNRLSKDHPKLLVSERSYNMATFVGWLNKEFKDVRPAYLVGSNRLVEAGRGLLGQAAWNYYLPDWLPERKTRQWRNRLAIFIKEIHNQFVRQSSELRFNGIAIDHLLADFTATTLPDQLLRLYCQAHAIDQIFRRARPVMVLSQLAYGPSYLMGETARRYNVPSVIISHGSHTPPKSEFSRLEWEEHGLGLINTVYQYQAIQTPLAQQYIEKIPSLSDGWKTGPLLLAHKKINRNDRLLKREVLLPGIKQKYILMHAGTAKTIRGLRFYVYETSDEYIQNLNHLITEVEKLDDTYLIVRFRPSSRLSIDTFKMLLRSGKNYGIYCDGDFQDYLTISDLLVSYSSTTIEEALQNEVPVLQYDPQGKYCHVEGQTMNGTALSGPSTCYFVGAREHLAAALEWIVHHHLKTGSGTKLNWARHRFAESSIVPIETCVKPFLGAQSVKEVPRE